MSSENDEESKATVPVLEKCEVCHLQPFKYKCPRCGRKSCSLNCIKLHKERNSCTGVPDKATFVDLKGFTLQQLRKDMGYLTDIIDVANRNSRKYATKFRDSKIEGRFKQLRYVCKSKRGSILKIGPAIFEMYKRNKSYYKRQEDTVHWSIGCTFIREEDSLVCYFAEPVSEKTKVGEIVQQFADRTKFFTMEINSLLSKREPSDIEHTRVFIKSRHQPQQTTHNVVYKELGKAKTLEEELRGEEITDFPMLYLILPGTDISHNKLFHSLLNNKL